MTTIPQQETIKQYIGNAVEDTFIVPFYTPLADDGAPAIDVYVTPSGDPPIPETDIKTWPTDYKYTPNADPITGGVIVFQAGQMPPLGSSVTLSRNIPAELSVEFSDATNFSGANLDDALFSLLLITQQNKTFALNRNLSYIVNSLLPDATIEAMTQLPVLGANQIWQGNGTGVAAVTLEENPDVGTLRSELALQTPLTNGASIIGYYDTQDHSPVTLDRYLDTLNIFGTDSGTTNHIQLTITNTSFTAYRVGMTVKFIMVNTNSVPGPDISINGLSPVVIYRNNNTLSQPQDLIAGNLVELFYIGGNKFIHLNVDKTPSGSFKFFGNASSSSIGGYYLCDFSEVSRVNNPALFAAIGTTWGPGDGSTTFNVPDGRRCTIIGSGGVSVQPPANTVGSVGGAEQETIAIANMPAHTHPGSQAQTSAVAGSGDGAIRAGSTSLNVTVTVASQGGGVPLPIMQPSIVALMMIKI